VKAWIFGSYSRGEQRPWSDVDITEIDNAVYKQTIESARRMKTKGYAVENIAEIVHFND